MLVEDIMQKELVTVAPATTLPEAMGLARRRGIRHLLVVEDGALVGIVSDRDLKQALSSPAASLNTPELARRLDRLTVGEIMTRRVRTIAAMFPVEEAARVMLAERISALPVMDDGGRPLGIVTETDVLQLLVRGLGAGEPSSRIDVLLGQDRAALADVLRVVDGAGGAISSVMTLAGPGGGVEAVIRVATINPGPAIKALEGKGYTIRGSWRG